MLDPVSEVLAQIRRSKTEAKTSQKTPVSVATIHASAAHCAAIDLARAELTDAGSVESWVMVTDESASSPAVNTTLALDGSA